MSRLIRCECGFVARADSDDAVIDEIRVHMAQDHPALLEDEGPRHEVTLTRPVYLGTHEVTVGQFRTFVEATRYQTEAESSGNGADRWTGRGLQADVTCSWRNPGWRLADDMPVACVSWNDASAFCTWLKKKEGGPESQSL